MRRGGPARSVSCSGRRVEDSRSGWIDSPGDGSPDPTRRGRRRLCGIPHKASYEDLRDYAAPGRSVTGGRWSGAGEGRHIQRLSRNSRSESGGR